MHGSRLSASVTAQDRTNWHGSQKTSRAGFDAESSSPPGLKRLPPIADMRGVFKGLLRDHLGLDEEILESPVFPGSRDVPTYENLVRA